MKSFKKFSFFRSNKRTKDDEKENLDESRHVQFGNVEEITKSNPQRPPKFQRRNSFDNLCNPTNAYHVPSKPRDYRPTRSCIGPNEGGGGGYSSSDDDKSTLVSTNVRGASYRKPPRANKKVTMQLQQKHFHMETSSEYGSGGPSPVETDHLAFQSHFTGARYEDYEALKMKCRKYKDYSRQLQRENFKIKQSYELVEKKELFYNNVQHELNILRQQNADLQSQIKSLNIQLRNQQQQHYMPPLHSAYPLQLFPSNNGTQFSHPQHCIGAGEKLVSHTQMPAFSTTTSSTMSSSLGSNNLLKHGGGHQDEADEMKIFRNELNQSSDDQFGNASYSSSPIEQARKELETSSLRHDRTLSLTILQDDGYGTNQSNQTLSMEQQQQPQLINDVETTPVKPPLRGKRVRFCSQ